MTDVDQKLPILAYRREKRESIARQCLTIMGRRLKKNIRGLASHGTSRLRLTTLP
jgi:hypothetical protein